MPTLAQLNATCCSLDMLYGVLTQHLVIPQTASLMVTDTGTGTLQEPAVLLLQDAALVGSADGCDSIHSAHVGPQGNLRPDGPGPHSGGAAGGCQLCGALRPAAQAPPKRQVGLECSNVACQDCYDPLRRP